MLKTIKEITFPEANIVQIEFELPQGYTDKELTDSVRKEVSIPNFKTRTVFGKTVRLYGWMTLGMAAVVTHKLWHVARAIEMFDPKENEFYTVKRG